MIGLWFLLGGKPSHAGVAESSDRQDAIPKATPPNAFLSLFSRFFWAQDGSGQGLKLTLAQFGQDAVSGYNARISPAIALQAGCEGKGREWGGTGFSSSKAEIPDSDRTDDLFFREVEKAASEFQQHFTDVF